MLGRPVCRGRMGQTVQHRWQAALLAKQLGLRLYESSSSCWPAVHHTPTGCRLAVMHQSRLLGLYCRLCVCTLR